jgi:hypothetical protein
MHCALCHLIIDSRTAWRSSTNRFYCSEFCADSETSAPFEQGTQKDVHDRQYLERLRRLFGPTSCIRLSEVTGRCVRHQIFLIGELALITADLRRSKWSR